MSATETISSERHAQILEDSVRQQRPLVLTHNSREGWRTFKAAFVAVAEATPTITLRVEHVPGHSPECGPKAGDTLGGNFRLGHKKCMFNTTLIRARQEGDAEYWIIRRPDGFQQLQRRAYERAVPTKGLVVAVRFWPENAAGETPNDGRAVRHGQLEDLSAGGMRVKVAESKDLETDRTYRCVFTPRPGKPALVLDAVLRHREASEQGRSSLGFQFVGLETSDDGLKALDRLVRTVQHFHRAETQAYAPRPSGSP